MRRCAVAPQDPSSSAEPKPARRNDPILVAEGKSPVLLCQFVDQLANRLRSTGDGAKEAHFLAPAALRNRNSKPLFARIEGHVGRILLHGSSPMLEALTGIARSTLDAGM